MAKEESTKLSPEQIRQCIEVLESLNNQTNQIFDIPNQERLALIIAAGTFSRPSKEELLKRKRGAKKVIKKKIAAKDKEARNATGIRSAREAAIFIAPTMIDLTGKEHEK